MSETALAYQTAFPPPPPVYWVCCHCKRLVIAHRFCCDGHWLASWHCPSHGDVVPMLSAVVNYGAEWPDWSAA